MPIIFASRKQDQSPLITTCTFTCGANMITNLYLHRIELHTYSCVSSTVWLSFHLIRQIGRKAQKITPCLITIILSQIDVTWYIATQESTFPFIRFQFGAACSLVSQWRHNMHMPPNTRTGLHHTQFVWNWEKLCFVYLLHCRQENTIFFTPYSRNLGRAF